MTVVVGVDGSVAAERALVWAVGECARRSARLEVVHAWSIPGGVTDPAVRLGVLADAAQLLLDRQVALARSVEPGVEVDGVLFHGGRADALVELARGARLLVVGSRGRGPLLSLVLGSVTAACIHRATCPVVVVRHSGVDAAQRIVVGVDGSDASLEALRWADAEARLRRVRLSVLHAWRPPFAGEITSLAPTPTAEAAMQREAEAVLHSALDELGPAQARHDVDGMIVRGAADEVLLDASETASMLVVGSRGHGLVASAVLGSVSSRCLHDASCPVVVLPRTAISCGMTVHSSATRSS